MTTRRNKPYNRLKGVDAFIGESASSPSSSPLVQCDRIVTSSSQPRRYFDPDKLEQLTQSVKEHGVLEPLLVRPLSDDRYELVAGERRYRAASAAGLTEVPVIIKELTDSEALQLALIENLQREDLNPVEETEGILQLLALKLESGREEVISLLNQLANAKRGFTDNVVRNEEQQLIEEVFASVGRLSVESFRTHRLPLLNLPEEVLEALRSGQIEYTKAKAIATLKDEELRKELLSDAITNALSLSQIKEKVNALKPVKQKEELKTRVDTTYKKLKTSKQLWQDPKKRKKLESLLSQLEQLIESEAKSEVNKAKDEPTPETSTEESKEETGLTDGQLAELLGVSNLLISDYRVKGKKPRGQALAKALTEQWEVKEEVWVKKS